MVGRIGRIIPLTILPLAVLQAVQGEHSVFPMLEKLEAIDSPKLWPGFNQREIPAAIFDGEDSYLIHSVNPPNGFSPMDERLGTFIYRGRHPQINGNGRIQLDGTWVATVVLRERSPLTGDVYTPKYLAAILLHEMFHVHQRLHNPGWAPNEAVLFSYPFDTPERLYLRRVEMQSFLRALNSLDNSEARRWSATALAYREKRLSLLGPDRRKYEDELQRFEGLGNYVERKAAGKSLAGEDRYQEFSPGVIRDLGYLEGSWTAGLLDRLDPAWKREIDRDSSQSLATLLSQACSGVSPMSFSQEEFRRLRETARADFAAWEAERTTLKSELEHRPGYQVVIDSEALPLTLRMFFATHTEALNDRESLHRRLFMAANSNGSLEIRRRDCTVTATGPSSILRVTIPGFLVEPEIMRTEGRVLLEAEGVRIDFSPATVSRIDQTVLIKIQVPSDSAAQYHRLGEQFQQAGVDIILTASSGFGFNPYVERAKTQILRLPTPFRTPKLQKYDSSRTGLQVSNRLHN